MTDPGGVELVPIGPATGDETGDSDHPAGSPPSRGDRITQGLVDAVSWTRDNSSSVCLALTVAGITLYTLIFSSLSIRNYRHYGNWAYDMAIYDQAMWLVSRFGGTFMTVRGMDVWGHHVTLIAYVFAPFYRLGAGPEFLFIVQSFAIALGALPVYLIAKRRFGSPAVGLLFAGLYLMYAPLQNINQRDFHPESLVIAPFLFAWYCAVTKRWRWFFACLVIAMSTREDAALAVVMLGIVLFVVNWRSETRYRDAKVAAGTVLLGLVWYGVSTQIIIPHFNGGDSAFYLQFFYNRYGGSFSGIVENILRHPNMLVSDAVQHDRLTFYKQLLWPLGWLPLLSPLHLLMAFPQLLASVIGDSPYARTILYQYTSVMIAPIMIASIEGSHRLWRFRTNVRLALVVIPIAVASYVTNVAWSPSPIADRYSVSWSSDRTNPRAAAFDEAIALVPDDAAVTSSFNFGPHLARRRQSYDWPNPLTPAYWGNELPGRADCRVFPSVSVIDYIVLDMNLYQADATVMALINAMTGPDGDFEVVSERLLIESNVLVARRTKPGPDGEPLPPNCSTDPATPASLQTMLANYDSAGAIPVVPDLGDIGRDDTVGGATVTLPATDVDPIDEPSTSEEPPGSVESSLPVDTASVG